MSYVKDLLKAGKAAIGTSTRARSGLRLGLKTRSRRSYLKIPA